jgi:hypothetical protein
MTDIEIIYIKPKDSKIVYLNREEENFEIIKDNIDLTPQIKIYTDKKPPSPRPGIKSLLYYFDLRHYFVPLGHNGLTVFADAISPVENIRFNNIVILQIGRYLTYSTIPVDIEPVNLFDFFNQIAQCILCPC